MRRLLFTVLLTIGCGTTAPTPVAAPTAAPTAAPVAAAAFDATTACGFGPNPTARIARCEAIHGGIRGDFSSAVEAAQEAINKFTRIDLFFADGTIRSEAEYTAALVLHIGHAGLCAVKDNGDTLLVKQGDSYSEEFDVVRVDGGDNVPVPVGSLRSKCRPSSF